MSDRLEISEQTIQASGTELPIDLILDDHRGIIWFFDPGRLACGGRHPFLELCRRVVEMVYTFRDTAPKSLASASFVVFAGDHHHYRGMTSALMVSRVNERVYERLRKHSPAQLEEDSGGYQLLSSTNFIPILRYEAGRLIGYLGTIQVAGTEQFAIPEEYLAREDLEVRQGCVLPRDEHRERFWCWSGEHTLWEAPDRDEPRSGGTGRPWLDPGYFAPVRPPVMPDWQPLPDPEQPRTMLFRERFAYLNGYFLDSDGESLHTADVKGNVHLLFKVGLDDCQAVTDADWGVEWEQKRERSVELRLVIQDRPDDPLNIPFIFNLTDASHSHEAIRLVEQEEIDVSIVTAANEGLGFFEGRKITLPDSFRSDLALKLRELLSGIEFENFPTPYETALLQALRSRDMRVPAAEALGATGLERFVAPLMEVLPKITWAEVPQFARALSGLGLAAVPGLTNAARGGKKSVVACAMRALGTIGGPDAIEALKERLLALPTKGEAVEALIDVGPAAAPVFDELLGDSRGEIREMAVFGLGKLGTVDCLPRIEELAQNDRNRQVRAMAESAAKWLRREAPCEVSLRLDIPEGE